MRKASTRNKIIKIKVTHVRAPKVSITPHAKSGIKTVGVQPVRLRKPLIINREN